MAKPTILLIPGALHPATIYTATTDLLNPHGYPTQTLTLPSLAPANLLEDQYALDLAAIRERFTQLIEEEEKEVVLVLHSYAGLPGGDWGEEFSRDGRKRKGLKGGVVQLVFVMAFVVAEGFCPTAGGPGFPEWMKIDLENKTFSVTIEDAKKVFYNDMSEEEGDKWAKQLTRHSVSVFDTTTTHAAWRYVPSTFVNCKQDKTSVTQDLVNFLLDSARKEVPSAFDVVEVSETADHSPMLSQVEWFAGTLRRAAGASV